MPAGGLRLAATLSAFSYIYQGRQTQGAIGYANASDRTIRLSLRPQSASGLLSIDAPQRIAPGQRGEINLSYLIPADKPRYGTLRDALEVAVDGPQQRHDDRCARHRRRSAACRRDTKDPEGRIFGKYP